MLEPYPVGTFLIRFSGSDPGSFAINCKLADNKLLAIKVDTDENHGFLVKESGAGMWHYALMFHRHV